MLGRARHEPLIISEATPLLFQFFSQLFGHMIDVGGKLFRIHKVIINESFLVNADFLDRILIFLSAS